MRARRVVAVLTAMVALLAMTAPASAKPRNPKGGSGDALTFAGYQWDVKSSSGPVGPGPNVFSQRNAWVDSAGSLHLAIDKRGRTWRSAEVILAETLGYGTYRFTVDSSLADLDPNAVLGLFTWSDDPAQSHREIDIEFSRWGNAASLTNAGYTVQPYDATGHQHTWTIGTAAPTVHEFTWTPDAIDFRSSSGGVELASWTFDEAVSIPDAGGAAPRMNLWLFRGRAPTDGQGIEIVISDFEFVAA